MNQEIKQRWLAALRSGEYEQTEGYLHHGTGFCCLGVLCDLYRKDSGQQWVATVDDDETHITFLGNEDILPLTVQDWAGLSSQNPRVLQPDPTGDVSTNLAELNDGGYSFEEIADIIEEQL